MESPAKTAALSIASIKTRQRSVSAVSQDAIRNCVDAHERLCVAPSPAVQLPQREHCVRHVTSPTDCSVRSTGLCIYSASLQHSTALVDETTLGSHGAVLVMHDEAEMHAKNEASRARSRRRSESRPFGREVAPYRDAWCHGCCSSCACPTDILMAPR